MVRIVQLLDESADFQTRRSAATLAAGLGHEFDVRTVRIGYGGEARDVTHAVRQLRAEPADTVIHAWGPRALTAAALGSRGTIVTSPIESYTRRALGWLRAILNYRDVQVICPTATLRRSAVERGLPIERCHLIRPGVDFSRVQRKHDAQLRTELGFSKDDFVALPLGESTPAANHELAVWTMSILHVLDPHHKVLLWGRGSRARHCRRMAMHFEQPDLLCDATHQLDREVELEEILPAVDALLVTATDDVATLPIAIGMASGLPIVSTVTYTVAELLQDRHTAMMVSKPAPKLLSQRIRDLRADSRMQWSIADMARNEAYAHFAQTRFIEQYRAAYKQIADGGKVSIAQPAPAAGLRFHGRM